MKFNNKFTNRDGISINKYLNDICKIPLQTIEEEVATGELAKLGNKEAIDLLVTSNLRFVVSIAKQYESTFFDLPTLISEGNLGLIRAARSFEPNKGLKFITFAVWWIRQAIQEAVQSKNKLIRLPVQRGILLVAIKKEIQIFFIKNGREPTVKELSDILNIDEITILNVIHYIKNFVFLNDPINSNSDDLKNLSYSDTIEDKNIKSPDYNLVQESLSYDLKRALLNLPKNYGEILTLIHGIGCDPLPIEEIGIKFNLCSERIKQINRFSLKSIKESKKYDFLKTYL